MKAQPDQERLSSQRNAQLRIFDHNSGAKVDGELARVHTEIPVLKSGFETRISSQYFLGLVKRGLHLARISGKVLKRVGSFSCTDAALFDYCSVLIKQPYRTLSRSSSTKLHGAVQIISRALDSAQRLRSCLHARAARAFGPRKQNWLEGHGWYLVRDEVCLLLKQMLEVDERAKTAFHLKSMPGTLLNKSIREMYSLYVLQLVWKN